MPGDTLANLDSEPILLLTLLEDWSIRAHMADFLNDWRQALEAADTPVTAIVDIRKPPLPGLDDIIWGANQGARGSNAVIQHPTMREIYVVSTNPVLSLAARGLRSEAFGNARVSVFPTLEEALEKARSESRA